VGSTGEVAELSARERVVHEVQHAALGGRGPAQFLLLRRRHGHLAERVPVRPSLRHRGEQSGDFGSDRRRAAVADLGEKPGPVAVWQADHVRADTPPLQGEAEVEQGGTAGHTQLAVLAVGHRQPARRIDVQLDDLRAQAKGPWLGVVHRRRQAGGLEHRRGVAR